MKALFKNLFQGVLTHRKALLILMGIFLGLIILTNVTLFIILSTPKSCGTLCHYMIPYYQQWKTSSHNDVNCTKCHSYRWRLFSASTVKYLTNTYNPRARAEVEDKKCLQSGCHQERLLHGQIKYLGDILFDHKEHLGKLRRGKKLHCTSCHAQIVQGQHMAVVEEVCFICHFKGARRGQSITGCPSCHGTPTKIVEHEGFSFSHESYLKIGVACNQCHLNIAEGEGNVPEEKCYTCHVERLEKYEDSEFMHNTHVTKHIIDCFECHTKIRHGEIEMISALEITCTNCHQKLHHPQKQMYMGAGGEDVSDTPSRMFSAQVSCDGCHTRVVKMGAKEFGEGTLEVDPRSCVVCHGEGYDRMLDDWRRVIDRMLRDFQPWLRKAEKALQVAEASGKDVTEERILLEKAKFDYEFVIEGKGEHNVEYAVKLIKAAVDKVDLVLKATERNYQPIKRDRLLGTPDGYCLILCHARLGVPERLDFERMDFPHRQHEKDIGIECTRCHSPEKHKMRVITKSECMNCHHTKQDIACSHCHPAQNELYYGTAKVYGVSEMPDIMAEAVTCAECHDLSLEDQSITTIQEACVNCHEPGYEQMLIEWYNSIEKSKSEVIVLLESVKESLRSARIKGKDVTEAKKLYEEARHNYEIVEKGKGIHNQMFSEEILTVAQNKLNAALKELEKM